MNKLTVTTGISYILICLIQGCQSAPEPKDIAIESIPKTTAKSITTLSEKSVNPENTLRWQDFFKDLPDRDARTKLKSQLARLESKKDLPPEELLKKARNLKATGQIEKALSTYQELIRRFESQFDAIIETAQIFISRADLDRAYEYLVDAQVIIDRSSHFPKVDRIKYKYTLALAKLHGQKVKEARRMLSDIIAAQSDFVLAYQALAYSYLREQKYDLAEFVANRGIERSDDHAPLYNVVGIVNEKSGLISKAKQYYEKALEKNPELVSALVNRASLSLRNAEYEAAERDLNQAVAKDPNFVNAYVTLGVLFHKTGRYTSAKNWFLKALELNPESSFARYNLASLYANQFSDRNKALQLYYEVLQSQDKTEEIEELARIQIQGLRDSRLSLND